MYNTLSVDRSPKDNSAIQIKSVVCRPLLQGKP